MCGKCGRRAEYDAPGRRWRGVAALPASGWELILLLDNREVRSRDDRSYLQSQLLTRGVACEVRQLPLGDAIWVVRRRGVSSPAALPLAASPIAAAAASRGGRGGGKAGRRVAFTAAAVTAVGGEEFVTDYIVERKAVEDLAASIIDGRYQEQKARLGATAQRVIYLVEGNPSKLHAGAAYGNRISAKHILGAMVSTQVLNGYQVVNTTTIDHSIAWLSKMHFAISALVFGGGGGSGGGDASGGAGGAAAAAPMSTGRLLSMAAGAALGAGVSDDWAPARVTGGIAMSQTAAQMADIAAARVVWPVGGGMRGGGSGGGGGGGGGGESGHYGTPGGGGGGGSRGVRPCAADRCTLWGNPALPRVVVPYAEWAVAAAKPRALSVLHIFGRMLRQVQGCSADRAQAVLEAYATPAALAAAFEAVGDGGSAPSLLQRLAIPNQKGSLGPALSATLYHLYRDARYAGAPPALPPAPPRRLPAAAASMAEDVDGGGVIEYEYEHGDDDDSGSGDEGPAPGAGASASRGKPRRGGGGGGRGGWRGGRGRGWPRGGRGGRGGGGRGGGRGGGAAAVVPGM